MAEVDTGRTSPAISLCYDGGDPSHLEVAVPTLTECGLVGTFFLPSVELIERATDWAAAQRQGHEMASASLHGFTDERGNLWNWTLEMVEEDLRMSRKLLTEQFPEQTDFAFAYPGDQMACVTVAYDPQPATYGQVVNRMFRVARTAEFGLNGPSSEATKLKSCEVSGWTLDELKGLVQRTIDEGAWALLVFRGIGSGDLAIDVRVHRAFCDWLSGRISCGTVMRQALSRSAGPFAG